LNQIITTEHESVIENWEKGKQGKENSKEREEIKVSCNQRTRQVTF
jgi:hypothetical protein